MAPSMRSVRLQLSNWPALCSQIRKTVFQYPIPNFSCDYNLFLRNPFRNLLVNKTSRLIKIFTYLAEQKNKFMHLLVVGNDQKIPGKVKILRLQY